MPTIRNFALHAFEMPRKGEEGKALQGPTKLFFPAGIAATGGTVAPSYTEIEDAHLEELKTHGTAGSWFGPNALVVEGTPRYPAGSSEAKALQADADRTAKAAADSLHDAVPEAVPEAHATPSGRAWSTRSAKAASDEGGSK